MTTVEAVGRPLLLPLLPWWFGSKPPGPLLLHGQEVRIVAEAVMVMGLPLVFSSGKQTGEEAEEEVMEAAVGAS